METIVFFVNGARVNELQSYDLSWRTVEQQLKEIVINNQKKIIIAYDLIADINKLAELVPEGSIVYILRHTKPESEIVSSLIAQLILKNCIIEGNVQKQHNNPEYKMIRKIDEYGAKEGTTNLQQLEKVFDELRMMLTGDPILEAKLELLHNCLVPENVPSSIDSVLSSYYEAFSTFNTERSGTTVFDEKYIEALTKLRNKLLDS